MNKNLGFTLIEVLIALFILSIAVLGAGTIMVNNIRQENNSLIMTQTMDSANSLIERMRTMPSENFVSDYDSIPNAIDCTNKTCNVSQMKNYYIYQWKCILGHYQNTCNNTDPNAVILPNGDAKITEQNGNVTIDFKWNNNGSEKNWSVQSYGGNS